MTEDEDEETGEDEPITYTWRVYAYDSVIWPEGPQRPAIVQHWRAGDD